MPQMSRRGLILSGMCGLLSCVYGNVPAQADRPPRNSIPLLLLDVDGAKVRPLENKEDNTKGNNKGRKAAVFLFIAHDCPIANGYAPEINRLNADYSAKGIAFYIIYIEDDLPAGEAKRHALTHQFTCRALRDPKHLLVARLQATITPEAVVVAPNGRTLYQGRIDNRVQDLGKMAPQPTVSDLRNALDAILLGKPVPQPRTKAIGCFIPHVA